MRILHLTDSYLPTIGGIELHVRDLAAHQRARGDDVVVATRTPAGPVDSDDHVLRHGEPGWLEAAAPDVVQAHVSIISPFALAAARRAAYAGIPTVVTVHSIWTGVGRLPNLARDLWRIRSWPVTWTAVSERAAEPVREVLGVPVHVVPNAVDLDAWPAATPPPGPLTVVSVMRLTAVKRALPLARILRTVADHGVDLHATIVGAGPERAPLQRYLRRHRLEDRVRLTGALDRTAIRELLESASVFLAPAHRESFGIAALEARATGLPVVASAHSGVESFVRHGREGLLGADDLELARHTVRLLTDPVLRDRIAAHNRSCRPPYGWPDAVDRCDELYRLALGPVRGRVAAR